MALRQCSRCCGDVRSRQRSPCCRHRRRRLRTRLAAIESRAHLQVEKNGGGEVDAASHAPHRCDVRNGRRRCRRRLRRCLRCLRCLRVRPQCGCRCRLRLRLSRGRRRRRPNSLLGHQQGRLFQRELRHRRLSLARASEHNVHLLKLNLAAAVLVQSEEDRIHLSLGHVISESLERSLELRARDLAAAVLVPAPKVLEHAHLLLGEHGGEVDEDPLHIAGPRGELLVELLVVQQLIAVVIKGAEERFESFVRDLVTELEEGAAELGL